MLLSWVIILDRPMNAKVGIDTVNRTGGESQAHCNLFSSEKVREPHNGPLHLRRDILTLRHVCHAVRLSNRWDMGINSPTPSHHTLISRSRKPEIPKFASQSTKGVFYVSHRVDWCNFFRIPGFR